MGKIKRYIAASAIAAMTAFAGPASAVLLTSDAGYSGPVLDLGSYAAGGYMFTDGPVSLPGGITFTSSYANSVLGSGTYGLGTNGGVDSSAVIAGLYTERGWMRFTFAQAVSAFGVYINYAPSDNWPNPIIRALDANGGEIESYDLEANASARINTPGGINQFFFRGIDTEDPNAPEIMAFELMNAYIVAAGTANGGIPDGNSVPEPISLALVGLALLGLGVQKRFKST